MFVLQLLAVFVLLCKSSQGRYVAEGYFLVDHKALQMYINERTETNITEKKQKALEEMNKDIDYFLSEVNRLYLTFGPRGLDVEVRAKKLQFLDSDIFSHDLIFSGNEINEDDALAAIDDWVVNTKANATVGYDFVTLWTGYNIRGSIVGYSHIGSACTTLATSIVEFSGTYSVVTVTAHEIGHILGSSHDGAVSTNIMAAVSGPDYLNRWAFSVCSTTDIVDYINSLPSPSCLEKTSNVSVKPSVSPDAYTGLLMDPDVICERDTNSSDTYMCKDEMYNSQLPKGDNICSYIYCHSPGTSNLCHEAYTTDGLICDVGKRCKDGTCHTDNTPQTTNVDPNCIWGDQKVIDFTKPLYKGNCSGYIQKFGLISCYDSVVYRYCCATCKRLSSGIAGCEFGDTAVDCKNYTKESICGSADNQKLCCDYCKDYVGRRSLAVDLDVKLALHKPVEALKNTVNANKRKLIYDFPG